MDIKAMIAAKKAAQEAAAQAELSQTVQAPEVVAELRVAAEMDPTIAEAEALAEVQHEPESKDTTDIRKMEEHDSGFGSKYATTTATQWQDMHANDKADWYIRVWSGNKDKALAAALKDQQEPEVLEALGWTGLDAMEPEPAKSPSVASIPVLPVAEAKPKVRKSLAELLAEKKAAAAMAALAQEPSTVLSAATVAADKEANTSIPLADRLTGSASAAAGYEAAKEDTALAAGYKGAFSLDIQLNEKQLLAKDMAMAGKCFALIGPAGSGKTTTQREVAATLLQQGRLHQTSYKLQGANGARVSAPSIAFVAYTRRAAANLQRAVHKLPDLEEALRYNIMTVHALLEYEPIFFWDEEKQKESMRFEPQRHAGNPLDITHLVIEEASMLGLDLWDRLFDALPNGVQIIFIGDINQLPPVFGPSILNYALVQLPVVELDRVYRQAGDSHILENAHHILAGESKLAEAEDFVIMEGKQPIQIGQSKMAITLARIFEKWHEEGFYDPEQDMILSPFNKQDLGTTNMNKFIAQFLGQKRNAVVYEIIAGFNKHYLAVGDRVMVNKQDGIITEIVRNGNYLGQTPQPESAALTRFGVLLIDHEANGNDHSLDDEVSTLSYDNFSLASLEEQDVERRQQASHIVKVRILDTDAIVELTGAGDFSEQVFSLGHVLTVHKAQGCEWRKVFFIMHKDHATMHYRELVYTAVTRAREQFMWIAKRCYIAKAIENPRIKGNCLADKIEYFNANLDMAMQVRCIK